MPLARIRTHFPEEVSELCEALIEAGYVVETVRPEDFRIAPADLELTVDKLPAVEAWRHLPEAETVFVATETPLSAHVRGSVPAPRFQQHFVQDFKARATEHWGTLTVWTSRQARELRGLRHDLHHKARLYAQKASDLRRRLTPPREYRADFHPDSPIPAHSEPRIDAAIEQARLRQEELRHQQEAESLRLQEHARLAEESRRRAREAAEARALLEEQQRIEAMVRATEKVRERMVEAKPPAPRQVERRRPRLLPRTRRERAFFRAGIAAFSVSLGLGVLAAQALHPRPASHGIPKAQAAASVPFAKPATMSLLPLPAESPSAVEQAPHPVASFTTNAQTTTADLKSSRSRHAISDMDIADDQMVIVRKPVLARPSKAKPRATIAHYSDLD